MKLNGNLKISPAQIEIIDKLKKIDDRLMIRWDHTVDVPTLLSGKLSTAHHSLLPETAIGFITDIKDLFRMEDPVHELLETAVTADQSKNVVHAFQQVRDGIPVEGSIVRVQYAMDGTVSRVTNAYAPGIKVGTRPVIDADAALKSALSAAGAGWQAAGRPATLNIVKSDDKWHLAWKVAIDRYGRTPLIYYVDAEDGKVLYYKGGAFHGDGKGFYSRQVSLNTTADTPHKLIDTTRGCKITVHDLPLPDLVIYNDPSGKKYGKINSSGCNVNNISKDTDDHWTDTGPTRWDNQGPEVDLAYYFGKIVDYFKTQHGRIGFDGSGGTIEACAHDGYAFGMNAEFDDVKNIFYFGDGDGDQDVRDANGDAFRNPDPAFASMPGDGKGMNFLTSYDIVAHEFTHALICNTARFARCPEGICPDRKNKKLKYKNCGQSYTLHEAIADIFACIITDSPDMGKGVLIDPSCSCIRTLNDPSSDRARSRRSNHMSAAYDSLNKGYVSCLDMPIEQYPLYNPQMNMGPIVYAGYLMIYGGIHPKSAIRVEGIGREKTARILYHALTVEMAAGPGQESYTSFTDFMDAMVDAAKAVYQDDPDYYKISCSIRSAFNAVGIGSVIISPKPPVLYELPRVRFPWWPMPPDPRKRSDLFIRWPIDKPLHDPDLCEVPLRIYARDEDIVVLKKGRVRPERTSRGRGRNAERLKAGKDYVSIRLVNAGSEEGGFIVNLFASSPGNMTDPSGWKWIGSTSSEGIMPGEESVTEVAIEDIKALKELGVEGEICLIAQVDSSIDYMPFKAEGQKELKSIDLESSEFIGSKIKISP